MEEENIIPTQKSGNNKKILLIITAFLSVTLLITTVVLLILLPKNEKVEEPEKGIENNAKTQIQNAPRFTATKYTFKGNLPTKNALNTYALKSNFSIQDAQIIAGRFGLKNYKTSPAGDIYFYELSTPENIGAMTFNPKSGSFTYHSQGELKVNNYSISNPKAAATNFLTTTGLHDPTILCNATYKNVEQPTVTYVECHRDWKLLGAPLISPVGLLNIEDTKKLSDTYPGNTTLSSPIDPAIYEASMGMNGRARPNDFNTVTIGFFPDGRIHSVNSTLRLLSQTNKNLIDSLITPEEALQGFIENKGALSLSLPLGNGTADWNKIYPTGYAVSDDAEITEFSLAYLEKPTHEDQKSYIPVYLVRGIAQLTTGYRVKFVSAIPAIKGSSEVLAATTGSPKSINIGTFDPSIATPTPTYSPTPIPTLTPQEIDSNPTPTVVVNTGPNVNTKCYAATMDTLNIVELNVEGYGKLTVSMNWNNDNTFRTYHFVSDKIVKPSPEFNSIRDAFFKAVEQQYIITAARRLSSALTPPTNARERATRRNTTTTEALQRAIEGPTSRGDLPSTIPNCTPEIQVKGGSCFDMTKAQVVSDAIKNRLEPIKDDLAKINEIASKPNLFPDKTLSSLSWLFHFYVAAQGNPMNQVNAPQEDIRYACYITGESPRIFFYGDLGNITIKPGKKITYSEVEAVNNEWSGTVASGIFTDAAGRQHSTLYYEYDASFINLPTPTSGYVTTKSTISTIIRTISTKLGLTFSEEKALLVDAQNALYQKAPGQKVVVSLLSELDQIKHIPLSIDPITTVRRVHLMITPINASVKINPPTLTKIKRGIPMILEVGVLLNSSN